MSFLQDASQALGWRATKWWAGASLQSETGACAEILKRC